MMIYVDADASPITKLVEELAKTNNMSCTFVSDFNHVLKSDSCEIITVGSDHDAADLKIVSLIKPYDILITQDYGLASLALAKKAYVMNDFGKEYTVDNIDLLLAQRHFAAKARKSKQKIRLKGPAKRKPSDDDTFYHALNTLIHKIMGEQK